jgi:hypothetical protein
MVALKKTDKVLRPVHPNAGIEAAYRNRLQKLIDEMNNSFVYWLKAAYRQNPPLMAQDRNPAQELRAAITSGAVAIELRRGGTEACGLFREGDASAQRCGATEDFA